jgi:FkbM family methyltransferase
LVELDLSDTAQAQAYLIRRYEPEIVAALARLLPRGGVFFDIGANIGLVTFSVGARRPDIRIFAFEPDPANARRWRHNLEMNEGLNAVLEQVALGAKEGEAILVRGDESGWSHIGSLESQCGIKVPMMTIDAYARTRGIVVIDALKVDVEGYEPFVFDGAASLLEKQAIGCIVCEVNESLLEQSGFTGRDIVSLLSGYGYSARSIPPVGVHRLRRRSVGWSGNLLFVPE